MSYMSLKKIYAEIRVYKNVVEETVKEQVGYQNKMAYALAEECFCRFEEKLENFGLMPFAILHY